MRKIIRTKTRAEGGITEEERAKMKEVADFWTKNAMRTDTVDVDRVTRAVHSLYAAANLKTPRVIVVPSPLVMAFSGVISACVLEFRARGYIPSNVISNATIAATEGSTIATTHAATDVATFTETYAATKRAVDKETNAPIRNALIYSTIAKTLAAIRAATCNEINAVTKYEIKETIYANIDAANTAINDAINDETFNATYNKTNAATKRAIHKSTQYTTINALYDETKAETFTASHDVTCNEINAAIRDEIYAETFDDPINATINATDAETNFATFKETSSKISDETFDATIDTTRREINAATFAANIDATNSTPKSLRDVVVHFVGDSLANDVMYVLRYWSNMYQGGNMWGAWCSYISASRDVLGLDLPEYKKYASYEQCAIEGGFRMMHKDFCIVSDRPEILKVDKQNRPHCKNGPSHRWRDGWSIYHWHGVKIPAEWIENKSSLTAKTALTWENIEQRLAACEIVGWAKILKELDAKVIDKDDDPEIGTLLEVDLPDSGKERFIHVICGTGREFALPVPKDCGNTALEAFEFRRKREYTPEGWRRVED